MKKPTLTEFLDTELKKTYSKKKEYLYKHLLTAPLNYYIEKTKDKEYKYVRHFFSHYHHSDSKCDTEGKEIFNIKKKNIFNIINDISKELPTRFNVIMFNKIVSEYGSYLNNDKFIPNLLQADKKEPKLINKSEPNYIEILYKEENEYYKLQVYEQFWGYFFKLEKGELKFNDAKHKNNIIKKLRQFESAEKPKPNNKSKKNVTFRFGKRWITEKDIKNEELIKKVKEEYKPIPIQCRIKNNIEKFYNIANIDLETKFEENKKDMTIFLFFPFEKLKIEINKKAYKKNNKILIDYFLLLHKIQKVINHKKQDTPIIEKSFLKDIINLFNDDNKQEPFFEGKDGQFYIKLGNSEEEKKKVSKLKKEIDKLVAQNYGFALKLIQRIFEFEKVFFKKNSRFTSFDYKNLNEDKKKELRKHILEILQKKIGLEDFFNKIKDFRNSAFHYSFAPDLTPKSILTEIFSVMEKNKDFYTKNPTKKENKKTLEKHTLHKILIALYEYSKRKKFNPPEKTTNP